MSRFVSRQLVARGRVQHVGFRAFVLDIARAFDIRGWVRNNPDGSVEIAAQGIGENLRSFIEQVEIGPHGSRVDELEINEIEAEEGWIDFRIVR